MVRVARCTGGPPILRRLLPALLLATCVAAPARAQDAPSPTDVRRAVDAGAAWLRKEFAEGFVSETRNDPVEVVVLTLSHAGANLDDPVFARGLKVLEGSDLRFTYRVALTAMALSEVNPRRYQGRIAHCAQWLVDTQLPEGEWGYPGAPSDREGVTVPVPETTPGSEEESGAPKAKVSIARRTSGPAYLGIKGDFSNTQFAILGLRACRDAGVEVPKETWKAALDYLRRYQRKDGGWGYVMTGAQDEASYASLTCAGICSAAICLHALGTKDVRSDAAVKRGLGWLKKNLDLTRNVGIDQSVIIGPSPWQYYHLYSLERAARVLGLTEVEGRAWYPVGARWLLEKQRPDGSWVDESGLGTRPRYMDTADTCFAILFLARATRPLTGG
ncbi:MAG TPA: prenyltransferase/squalene oxidase repeat-containing protein [Planctomycetota bacterium]|nr:prenyltransferase/squalene oxidase repeat-containing protein [Planctomycetota bacterium]